jgi:ABC-type bacteriocin/lantibiotic exporter with double-glycine peptidase domain
MASTRGILLMDEAMANLDPASRRRIQASPWFADRTILYASHDAGLGGIP